MKTDQEIREKLKLCDKTIGKLSTWSKTPNSGPPKCWLGGSCCPEECNAGAALAWVLDKKQ